MEWHRVKILQHCREGRVDRGCMLVTRDVSEGGGELASCKCWHKVQERQRCHPWLYYILHVVVADALFPESMQYLLKSRRHECSNQVTVLQEVTRMDMATIAVALLSRGEANSFTALARLDAVRPDLCISSITKVSSQKRRRKALQR
jgi:hypothetical protein